MQDPQAASPEPENGDRVDLPEPFEVISVPSCAVHGHPLPDGRLALMFDVPNGRRYVFPLDDGGRQYVADVCVPPAAVPTFGPQDMPKGG